MSNQHANFENLGSFTIAAASGIFTCDFDTSRFNEIQLGIGLLYASVASALSNCSCTIYPGFGLPDATTWFFPGGTESETVTFDTVGANVVLATPVGGTLAQTTINWDLTNHPGWFRLKLINLDATNSCSLSLKTDAL